ncbi:EGF domain protein [Chondromyces apiculatus DSM 436]|uniref:EGF domain protein n=2 Tax=Chondromyces apiculatus TaxID=51 RepID=A0A017STN4_9BACT|nr:EGF domain protein [Chondromyces apiculatus DSM 436]
MGVGGAGGGEGGAGGGVVTPVCGDGSITGAEACDDGNTTGGDGCSSTCAVETGYTCAGTPSVCADINECQNGTDNCDTNAACTNLPGSFNCACNSGYQGDGTTCTDIDECMLGVDDCAAGETCVNTPGGFTCDTAVCAPPNMVCGSQCVDTASSAAHCGSCDNACAANQACESSTCVDFGNLRINVMWSRAGDVDLFVATPNGNIISYLNVGPNAGTDGGQLDATDDTGTGPESIFWDTADMPPSGSYSICLNAYNQYFDPDLSAADPVSYIVKVQRPGEPTQEFSGVYTEDTDSTQCAPGTVNYVGSFDYP